MTFYVRVSVSIFVFLAACVMPMIRGEDMHKYVGVARCRAECVDKLVPESNIGDEACMNDQSCFMCWETCSMLYMDYQVWGMMCKVPELCYEGCQVSCRFHEEHVFETQHLPTSDVNKLAVQMEDSDTELVLRWEPEGVPIDRAVVYQLTWRENEHSDWMGIVQTREIEHRLQKINFPEKFQLQIMAVDSKGILSATGSQYPADEQVLLLDISVAVATRDARLDATVTWKHKTDTTATGDIGYSIVWKRTSCNKDSAYPVCVDEEHRSNSLIVPSEKDDEVKLLGLTYNSEYVLNISANGNINTARFTTPGCYNPDKTLKICHDGELKEAIQKRAEFLHAEESVQGGNKNLTTIITIACCVGICVAASCIAFIIYKQYKMTKKQSPLVRRNAIKRRMPYSGDDDDDDYEEEEILLSPTNILKSDARFTRNSSSNSYSVRFRDVECGSQPRSPLMVIQDKWELEPGSLTIGHTIGKGSFSQVNMGRTGERIVAVKTCKDNTQHGRKVLMNETSVMKQLGAHPNVIGLIGAITVTEPITLITEYAGSGSLRNLLRKLHIEGDLMSTGGKMVIIYTGVDSLGRQEQVQATAVTLLGWAWQIANGMTYVTEKGFNHGDVTARNILVTDQGTVKLCDFGHAQICPAGNQISTDTHTIPVQSAAPETLQTGQRSEASDVWAFGVLLWEITTLGNELYSGIKEEDMLPYLLDGNRLKQSDYCSTQLYELMQSAWKLAPSERPGFRQLQQELQTMISSAHKHIDLMVVHTPGAMLSENDCTTSSCRSSLAEPVDNSHGRPKVAELILTNEVTVHSDPGRRSTSSSSQSQTGFHQGSVRSAGRQSRRHKSFIRGSHLDSTGPSTGAPSQSPISTCSRQSHTNSTCSNRSEDSGVGANRRSSRLGKVSLSQQLSRFASSKCQEESGRLLEDYEEQQEEGASDDVFEESKPDSLPEDELVRSVSQ